MILTVYLLIWHFVSHLKYHDKSGLGHSTLFTSVRLECVRRTIVPRESSIASSSGFIFYEGYKTLIPDSFVDMSAIVLLARFGVRVKECLLWVNPFNLVPLGTRLNEFINVFNYPIRRSFLVICVDKFCRQLFEWIWLVLFSNLKHARMGVGGVCAWELCFGDDSSPVPDHFFPFPSAQCLSSLNRPIITSQLRIRLIVDW